MVRAGLDQPTINAHGFDMIWTRWAGRQSGAVLGHDENVDQECPPSPTAPNSPKAALKRPAKQLRR